MHNSEFPKGPYSMVDLPILETKELVLDLGGRRILDHLSIECERGRIHAVVGPNGAGKSTLANAIMGLSGYTEFDGDILFDGEPLTGLSIDERAKRGLTLAWQEPARYEGLSVESFIGAGAGDRSPEKLERTLKQVGLDPSDYMSRAVDKTVSGGERKRIELASILAMEPKLVIMDEPDSGIDVEALSRIFEAMEALKKKGTTVLLITHSSTVLAQADNASLICCGRLIEKGPVEKIIPYFGEKCMPCDHKNAPLLGDNR
jgi:Fe-S cluster assembly ATP-binding protein